MAHPTDEAKIHWPRPFTPDLIRLRVKVVAESEDTVSKMWVSHTDQVLRSWEVFAPMFSFSKMYDYSTGEPDIEVQIANFGATGWLSRSEVDRNSQYQILRATVKLNAFYMSGNWDDYAPYAEGVFCHEFGHVLGLDDNRPGVLDGSPDNSCMNEAGLFQGTASNRPNIVDTNILNDLYSYPAYPEPTSDHVFTEVVDSILSSSMLITFAAEGLSANTAASALIPSIVYSSGSAVSGTSDVTATSP